MSHGLSCLTARSAFSDQDQTRVPGTGGWMFIHRATGEVPSSSFLIDAKAAIYCYVSVAAQEALVVKRPLAKAGGIRDAGLTLGQEDPLEKEVATHSSVLAWRIPRTEEPGRLQSTGS